MPELEGSEIYNSHWEPKLPQALLEDPSKGKRTPRTRVGPDKHRRGGSISVPCIVLAGPKRKSNSIESKVEVLSIDKVVSKVLDGVGRAC